AFCCADPSVVLHAPHPPLALSSQYMTRQNSTIQTFNHCVWRHIETLEHISQCIQARTHLLAEARHRQTVAHPFDQILSSGNRAAHLRKTAARVFDEAACKDIGTRFKPFPVLDKFSVTVVDENAD